MHEFAWLPEASSQLGKLQFMYSELELDHTWAALHKSARAELGATFGTGDCMDDAERLSVMRECRKRRGLLQAGLQSNVRELEGAGSSGASVVLPPSFSEQQD